MGTDHEIIQAWRQHPGPRERAAFDALIVAAQPRVIALCRRMVRDPQLALEISQDAMLTAVRRLDDFREDGVFAPWVWGIARGLCLNAVRRHRDALSDDGVVDDSDGSRSALLALLAEERIALVREVASEVLDDTEQEAVHLRYVEGLGQAEISRILGLSGTGARGLLQTCRRKLTRALRQRLRAMGHGSSFARSDP